MKQDPTKGVSEVNGLVSLRSGRDHQNCHPSGCLRQSDQQNDCHQMSGRGRCCRQNGCPKRELNCRMSGMEHYCRQRNFCCWSYRSWDGCRRSFHLMCCGWGGQHHCQTNCGWGGQRCCPSCCGLDGQRCCPWCCGWGGRCRDCPSCRDCRYANVLLMQDGHLPDGQ